MSQFFFNSKKFIRDVFFWDVVALSNLKEPIQKTLEEVIVSDTICIPTLRTEQTAFSLDVHQIFKNIKQIRNLLRKFVFCLTDGNELAYLQESSTKNLNCLLYLWKMFHPFFFFLEICLQFFPIYPSHLRLFWFYVHLFDLFKSSLVVPFWDKCDDFRKTLHWVMVVSILSTKIITLFANLSYSIYFLNYIFFKFVQLFVICLNLFGCNNTPFNHLISFH